MKVIVSGKHLDIGNSLREHVESSLVDGVNKYFEQAVVAHVTVAKKSNLFRTDIIVNEGTGTGIIIKANSEEYDAYRSVDDAIHKIEKQLRRYKTKLKNHHKRRVEFTEISGTKYVIPVTVSNTSNSEEDIGDAPTIIAENPSPIRTLSVSDAVMQMDLLNLPALVFVNAATNTVSAVYYRKDNNISWVDSTVSYMPSHPQ